VLLPFPSPVKFFLLTSVNLFSLLCALELKSIPPKRGRCSASFFPSSLRPPLFLEVSYCNFCSLFERPGYQTVQPPPRLSSIYPSRFLVSLLSPVTLYVIKLVYLRSSSTRPFSFNLFRLSRLSNSATSNADRCISFLKF